MSRITTRFVLLIATAAVAPLVVYGLLSVRNLGEGTVASVREGNLRLARQAGEHLQLYVENNARVLRSLGQELSGTDLAPWQQARILRNHLLEFPEFREISYFDAGGSVIATSRLGRPGTGVPQPSTKPHPGRVQIAPIFSDEDNLPATDLSVRLGTNTETQGWLVARLSLEELWRFVDGVRVGREGFALVVSEGRLVAHGDPDEKRNVAVHPSEDAADLPELELLRRHGQAGPFVDEFIDDGRPELAAAATIPDLNWTVMVSQPVHEAYALAAELRRQLYAAIALALLGTVVIGWVWSRSFITRIVALTAATRALAAGRMDERVRIGGRDEIRQLGDAFNSMADRLVELQEDVRKQERQAMFGRIAAGLVHDLLHPIQNIGNSCKLIVKMYEDADYRETFRTTVEREMVIVKRVLEDLQNIARPIPLEHFPVDVNRSLLEAVDSMRPHADTAGLTLTASLSPDVPFVEGDVFALGRVYRNLILNAIQATAPGGAVSVRSEADQDRVRIAVDDTGCGIPADRLAAIFEDFMTTKRRGLGLGLAISRKIVEQLGGTITVASEVGRGTSFVLEFPRTRARPMLVAG